MNFYNLLKPVIFSQDPEFVHDHAMEYAHQFPQLLSKLVPSIQKDIRSDKYSIKGNHINWRFPIGLAAGLDKNAYALNFFDKIGFGAVEYGTVTPIAQYGNQKPRIHRYCDEQNIRNSMGFPSNGVENVISNLKHFNGKCSLGANIGKNKNSDGKNAYQDYAYLYKKLVDHSDYLVINVSSPNTPGLRNLQSKEFLIEILNAIKPHYIEKSKPLFIKIAPDINERQLNDFVSVASDFNLAGIVATNTTIEHQLGTGGLSGKCLIKKSASIRLKLLQLMKGTNLDLIGVGGVSSFKELEEFWMAGGKFMQIYTSFIFQGPQILVDIKNGIDHFLKKHKCSNLNEFFQDKTSI